MLACLLVAAPTRAQPNFYLDAATGWDYPDSIVLDSNEAQIDFDRGVFNFAGALGVRLFSNHESASAPIGWRLELGHSRLDNAPEILYGSAAGVEFDSDRLDNLSARVTTLNLVRDIQLGRAFYPYVGIGLGYGDVDLHFSESSVNGSLVQRPRRDVINDQDSGLALQFIAGFSVPVRSWLSLAADYRYVTVPDLRFSEITGDELTTDYAAHSVWLRARVQPPARSGQHAARPRSSTNDASRWYLSALAGGSFSEDMGLENLLTVDAFDPGPTVVLALGYRLLDRWRFEIEGAYRRSNVEIIELGPDIGEDAASGDMRAYSVMLNALRVFRPRAVIRPRVGLGAGLVSARFDTEVFGFCANLVCGAERREVFVNDRDTRPGFQVFAGVEAEVTPRIRFIADYRYLVTTKMRFRTPADELFRGSLRNTAVVAGLRVAL